MIDFLDRCQFPDRFIRARMECKEGLFGIGGSGAKTSRKNELGAWGNLNSIGGWATPSGENQITAGSKNLNTASDFWNTLLSGDKTKIGQVLAPEISTITGQTQQQIDSNAEFGNRSGGTNATLNTLQTTKNSEIQNLIDSLLPQAATQVAQIGTAQEGAGLGVLGTGESAFSTVGAQSTDILPTQYKMQQQIQSAIISSLIDAASMGVNAGTGGAGFAGFGEG